MLVVNLFFPKVCHTCYNALLKDFEQHTFVLNVDTTLPITNFHFDNEDNAVEKIFYGRVKVEHATALLRFEKTRNCSATHSSI